MGSNVALEVVALGKATITPVDRAYVRAITSVSAKMGPKVKVEGEPLATAFKPTLKWLLACVHQLMAPQLRALNKGLRRNGAVPQRK